MHTKTDNRRVITIDGATTTTCDDTGVLGEEALDKMKIDSK